MNIISLFFSPYDEFSGKFQSAHFAHFRHLRLVKAIRLFKFISLSLQEIVYLDILTPRLALALLEIAVAVANQSYFDSLPIHLSSFAVVFLGQPGDFLASHDSLSLSFLKTL